VRLGSASTTGPTRADRTSESDQQTTSTHKSTTTAAQSEARCAFDSASTGKVVRYESSSKQSGGCAPVTAAVHPTRVLQAASHCVHPLPVIACNQASPLQRVTHNQGTGPSPPWQSRQVMLHVAQSLSVLTKYKMRSKACRHVDAARKNTTVSCTTMVEWTACMHSHNHHAAWQGCLGTALARRNTLAELVHDRE
jgi:hypothetical protein